jgi:magnesium chelatase family protein
MLASAATFAVHGVDAVEVTVEADVRPGLPSFTIVGLPDTAVRESRERVRAALVNSGWEFPLQRITVNLAPADLRKAGPGFDMALAAALLAASGQVSSERLNRVAVIGELGLDGSARAVRGALAMAGACARGRFGGLIVPSESAAEASLIDGIEILGVTSLRQLGDLLAGTAEPDPVAVDRDGLLHGPCGDDLDLNQVRGHVAAKRALEVAAAGGHNLLMIGPPGSGKSMLARRLPSILPPLSLEEALEVTRVHSVTGLLAGEPLVRRRPFRAPHHSISTPGLIGGGSVPTPGEVSLATRGVLFLDEIAEFSRPALEALRQPLEEGCVRITRSQRTARFPAAFSLVAAANPCPCGHRGDPRRPCRCTQGQIDRQAARLSGPLLDRIDMVLNVQPPARDELISRASGEQSSEIRERVVAARRLQAGRLAGSGVHSNAEMTNALIERHCRLSSPACAALRSAHDRVGLSARGHHRVLRVARTLADLEMSERVERHHVFQAVAYRERPASRALEAAA